MGIEYKRLNAVKREGGWHARLTRRLLGWFDANARELPWRETRGAYAIWVSEIMLQQTRVDTVLPYYERFMRLFPTASALAEADETDVLKAWEGLGYYSRARNLHKGARQVAERFGGQLPQSYSELREICGIGDYTAGAILSQAYGQRICAVDGNAARVLARIFAVEEDIRSEKTRRRLCVLAQNLLPTGRPGDANQALMELGALVCAKRANCEACPIARFCLAKRRGKAYSLPLRSANKPPREVHVALALVFAPDGRLLVIRRAERLLGGLYGFPMAEGKCAQSASAALQATLDALGLRTAPGRSAGPARHVFTHRVWLMQGQFFAAECAANVAGGRWVDAPALDSLPMPTAVRVYRALLRGGVRIMDNYRDNDNIM